MHLSSKLPQVGTTIFTVMSAMAQECGAINLSQGFPDFSGSDRLTDLAASYLRRGFNQYAPMAGVPRLRERLAEKIEALFGAVVHPDQEITITAGATQAIFTAIATVVRPGDEVVFCEPAYDSYRPAVELFGGVAKAFELSPPDYRIDWEQFRRMLTARTRLVILNTPHNPTGSAWSIEDMARLEALLRGTDILVLSDEVYEHLIYDGQEHQSVLRFPELRERSFAIYSFGKTFHNTGWKIGYCVAPPQLTQEFRKVHQFNVFCVNTPLQHALADFLEDPGEYLMLNSFYQDKRDFFQDALAGTGLRLLPCAGTYFQVCDYRAISDEPDVTFVERLTRQYGVAAIPVSVFYHSLRDERVIRFCFAKREETLEQAADRLRRLEAG